MERAVTRPSARDPAHRPAEARAIEPPETRREIEEREAALDEALENTFPASDPPALHGIT